MSKFEPPEDLMDLLCCCAQLIDSVKMEWQAANCWSEWDQSVRDGITLHMRRIEAERNIPSAPVSIPEGK